MDIRAGIQTAIFLSIFGLLALTWSGVSAIRAARKLMYFRLRQQRLRAGGRSLIFALALAGLALVLWRWGEPLAYTYFPPSLTPTLSPTPSLSPTITLTPSTTLTPSVTPTPAISNTPTITPTPFIPPVIEALFSSLVTPNPDAVFSPLTFSRAIDSAYQPIDPATVFTQPIEKIVATFSYDQMQNGTQWTALWLRDGQLLYHETLPWNGDTGGYGFTEWQPERANEWLAGEYEVQIFVGLEWKVVGRFSVEGDPATETPTASPSPTISPTLTQTSSKTPLPSPTKPPSSTPRPSRTPRPSDTPWPTVTP